MPRAIDLTRQRFGQMVVLERIERGKWRCRCDCGSEFIASQTRIPYREHRVHSKPAYACPDCLNARICTVCGAQYRATSPRQVTCPGECSRVNHVRKVDAALATRLARDPDYRRKLYSMRMQDPEKRARHRQNCRNSKQRLMERMENDPELAEAKAQQRRDMYRDWYRRNRQHVSEWRKRRQAERKRAMTPAELIQYLECMRTCNRESARRRYRRIYADPQLTHKYRLAQQQYRQAAALRKLFSIGHQLMKRHDNTDHND